LYVVKLRPQALNIDRARFIEELKTLGIGTSVHFIPLHMHPYYRDQFGYRPDALPVSRDVYLQSISLPVYSKMEDSDVRRVTTAVLELVKTHRR
jgi:dTDP-4-amino-4,6-dideoxygalactose transaminase